MKNAELRMEIFLYRHCESGAVGEAHEAIQYWTAHFPLDCFGCSASRFALAMTR